MESKIDNWRLEIQKFVSKSQVTNLFSWFISKIDLPVLKLSRGRLSLTGLITGWPIIILNTIGARSRKKRTTPLVGIPDGQNIILIASNFGKEQNPSWYHNVIAHPNVCVVRGGRTSNYFARLATNEEYGPYWQLAEATYSGYRLYRERTTRHIPIIVLDKLSE